MPIQGALAQMMLLPICIREGPVCPTTDYIYNESWHLHAVNSLRANWATYVSWREKELTVCVHLWCSTSSSGWPGAKSIIFSTMFGYFFRSLFTFRKIKQGGLWGWSDSHCGQPLVVGGVANSLGVTRLRKITQHEAPDQFLKPVATQLQWERNYSQRRTSGALIQFRLAASGVSPRDGLKFSCQPGSCQSDARSRAADERQSDTSSSASCVVRCQWHISPRHCNSPDGGGGSGERHPDPPPAPLPPPHPLSESDAFRHREQDSILNTSRGESLLFLHISFIYWNFFLSEPSTKAAPKGQSLHSVCTSHLLFDFVGK